MIAARFKRKTHASIQSQQSQWQPDVIVEIAAVFKTLYFCERTSAVKSFVVVLPLLPAIHKIGILKLLLCFFANSPNADVVSFTVTNFFPGNLFLFFPKLAVVYYRQTNPS